MTRRELYVTQRILGNYSNKNIILSLLSLSLLGDQKFCFSRFSKASCGGHTLPCLLESKDSFIVVFIIISTLEHFIRFYSDCRLLKILFFGPKFMVGDHMITFTSWW